MKESIVLLYSGGSGGFFLLHLLLLSGKFYTSFFNDKSINDAIESQWNITNPDNWKHSETWPDNQATQRTTTDCHKLYFYCLLPELSQMPELRSSKYLVLYTDISSQLELAYFKKARWFHNTRKKPIDLLHETRLYKNDLVTGTILPFLNSAKYVVKLQDIVNSNGSILEKLLGIPKINNDQIALINRWKKLHTPELLTKIGIDI